MYRPTFIGRSCTSNRPPATSSATLKEIAATGGTNWQKYLPPQFQLVIFFPDLWSEEERENWGKKVVRELFNRPPAHAE